MNDRNEEPERKSWDSNNSGYQQMPIDPMQKCKDPMQKYKDPMQYNPCMYCPMMYMCPSYGYYGHHGHSHHGSHHGYSHYGSHHGYGHYGWHRDNENE